MAESPAKRPKIADPDLKIVVDDGELDVHSLLLQLASPVFASMLNSEMQEGMTNSISLPGKTKGELEMFYKSLQVSTEEALTPEIATCLVKWADEYQIENLKTKCEQFLLSQPVNAQGLQFAVKYGLSKRTTQCLNQFKEDLVKHVDDIVVLTGREGEEYMKELWPLIIRKAGLDLPLPDIEHLPVIWPFLSAAVKGKAGSEQLATLQADSRRLQMLKTNVKTWPDQISNELNAASSTYRLRARSWMLRTLHTFGFYDVVWHAESQSCDKNPGVFNGMSGISIRWTAFLNGSGSIMYHSKLCLKNLRSLKIRNILKNKPYSFPKINH